MDFTDLVFVDDSAEDSDGSEDPPRILTNDDISLFGDVYKYIEARKDEDGRRVCLDLECLVCRDARLEVPPAVSPKRDEDVSIKPMMLSDRSQAPIRLSQRPAPSDDPRRRIHSLPLPTMQQPSYNRSCGGSCGVSASP
ncbi:hypothetical protein GGS26DRAFT_595393 [Hypomontagnella submonticulosa]|nr:hypothetical protein GGS26DRAFT_595393 [Hypomontagnella submonticulosa]